MCVYKEELTPKNINRKIVEETSDGARGEELWTERPAINVICTEQNQVDLQYDITADCKL